MSHPLVYIDLEGTLIRSWHDVSLINIPEVKKFLQALGVTDIGIFSFAIDNPADVEDFRCRIQPLLTDALGVTISDCPHVEAMIRRTRLATHHDHDLQSYKYELSKATAFQHYVAASDYAVLIDDTVPNQAVWTWPTDSHNSVWTVQTVNVRSLEFWAKHPVQLFAEY